MLKLCLDYFSIIQNTFGFSHETFPKLLNIVFKKIRSFSYFTRVINFHTDVLTYDRYAHRKPRSHKNIQMYLFYVGVTPIKADEMGGPYIAGRQENVSPCECLNKVIFTTIFS